MPSLLSIFYYLLGGVTFLPLCFIAGFIYFVLFAPLVDESLITPSSHPLLAANDESTNISQETKAAALDLAIRNAKDQEKLEEAKRSGVVDSGIATPARQATIPGAAKRLGPSGSYLPRPHPSGWLVVRKQFNPTPSANKGQGKESASQNSSATNSSSSLQPPSSETQADVPSQTLSSSASGVSRKPSSATGKPGYMSAMYRGLMDYRATRADAKKAIASSDRPPQTDKPSVTSNREVSPNNSATASPDFSAPKDAYFCVLKSPILYLYSSQDVSNPNTECLAAIDLRGKRVSMYINGLGDVEGEPNDEKGRRAGENSTSSSDHTEDEGPGAHFSIKGASTATTLRRIGTKDGELFQKRNAIRIVTLSSSPPQQWFIFLRSSTTLEDWYHALVHASLASADSTDPPVDPIGPVFDFEHMRGLLSSLDSLPDPIPLRWLNAMVGRVFYSIYRTAWIEEYVTRKLMRKISRVRTPGFLSDIRVKEVHLGSTPPAFSRPMLKSLTGDGEASMEVAIHYRGALRLTISTVLTISLGSRFKPYNVPLVLAVVVTSLEGNLLLQIKPPPSNRIWYGFTSLPKMDIDVEPVVSERKVQWSMVKRLIEGKIKELMMESLVVPNMDDIAFFDTRPNSRRGGIWAEAAVRRQDGKVATGVAQEVSKVKDEADKSEDGKKEDVVEGKATAVDPSLGKDDSLRNRRKNTDVNGAAGFATSSSSLPKDSATSASSSSSPAMAGLTALLARNNAQGSQPGASSISLPLSTSPTDSISSPSSSRHPEKRGHWFRGQKPQSSLAWGSASVLQNPEVPSSISLPATSGTTEREEDPSVSHLTLSTPSPDVAQHVRNRKSVSSTLSSVSSAATDDVHAAMADSMDIGDEEDRPGEDKEALPMPDDGGGGGSRPHSIRIPSTSSTQQNDKDGETPRPSVVQESEALVDKSRESTRSSSPGGITASPDEFAFDETAPTHSGASVSSSVELPTVSPRTASPGVASISNASDVGSTKGPSVQPPPPPPRPSQAYGPPPRRPTLPARKPTEDSISRAVSRESLVSETGSSRSTSAQQASALWHQAKSRMADKESRQATANQAKDALRKGWANWSSKRGASSSSSLSLQQQQQQAQQAANVREEWDRLERAASGRADMQYRPYEPASRSPAGTVESSNWQLGTTATDPVSLGAGFGFEMSPHGSPEWQGNGDHSRLVSQPSGTGSSASSVSASNGSHPGYREYRASRSRDSSRASSPGRALKPHFDSKHSSTDTELGGGRPSVRKASIGAGSLLSRSPGQDGFAFLPPAAKPLTGLVDGSCPSSEVGSAVQAPAGSSSNSEAAAMSPSTPVKALPIVQGDTEATPTHRNDVDTPRNAGLSDASSPTAISPSVSPKAASSTPLSRDRSRSGSSSTRIRSQPGQMTMMAIPGIQRKSGEPTSFSAPAPVPGDGPGIPATGSRLSLSGLKLPGFGSGGGVPTNPASRSMTRSTSTTSVGEEKEGAATNQAPAVAAPGVVEAGVDTRGTPAATSAPHPPQGSETRGTEDVGKTNEQRDQEPIVNAERVAGEKALSEGVQGVVEDEPSPPSGVSVSLEHGREGEVYEEK